MHASQSTRLSHVFEPHIAPLLPLLLLLLLELVLVPLVLVLEELELDVVAPPVPAGVLSLLLHAANASPVTATTAQNDVFMIDLHPRVT